MDGDRFDRKNAAYIIRIGNSIKTIARIRKVQSGVMITMEREAERLKREKETKTAAKITAAQQDRKNGMVSKLLTVYQAAMLASSVIIAKINWDIMYTGRQYEPTNPTYMRNVTLFMSAGIIFISVIAGITIVKEKGKKHDRDVFLERLTGMLAHLAVVAVIYVFFKRMTVFLVCIDEFDLFRRFVIMAVIYFIIKGIYLWAGAVSVSAERVEESKLETANVKAQEQESQKPPVSAEDFKAAMQQEEQEKFEASRKKKQAKHDKRYGKHNWKHFVRVAIVLCLLYAGWMHIYNGMSDQEKQALGSLKNFSISGLKEDMENSSTGVSIDKQVFSLMRSSGLRVSHNATVSNRLKEITDYWNAHNTEAVSSSSSNGISYVNVGNRTFTVNAPYVYVNAGKQAMLGSVPELNKTKVFNGHQVHVYKGQHKTSQKDGYNFYIIALEYEEYNDNGTFKDTGMYSG